MYTGSADHPWPESSTTPVAIVERATPLHRPDLSETARPGDDLTERERRRLRDVDDAWMAEAACKGRTSLFFGTAGERPERRVRRERTARGVCEGCSVIVACRERARAGRENGFWGGESEEERAAAGYPPRSISRRSVQQAGAVRAAAS
jgi:WhiB family redox-sensing transcriptional regulator